MFQWVFEHFNISAGKLGSRLVSLNLLLTQRICGYLFENLKIVSPRVNSHSNIWLSYVLYVTASTSASLWTCKRKGEAARLCKRSWIMEASMGIEEKGGPGRSSKARPSWLAVARSELCVTLPQPLVFQCPGVCSHFRHTPSGQEARGSALSEDNRPGDRHALPLAGFPVRTSQRGALAARPGEAHCTGSLLSGGQAGLPHLPGSQRG